MKFSDNLNRTIIFEHVFKITHKTFTLRYNQQQQKTKPENERQEISN